jgi:hypothetical protein
MSCVAEKTYNALVPVRVRLVDVETPHLDIFGIQEERSDAGLEIGVGV